MLKKQYRDAMRDLVIAEQRVDSAQEALKEAQKKVEEIDNLLLFKGHNVLDSSELACRAITAARFAV